MTLPITAVITLAATAFVFVLNQHGWGNTLISLGTTVATWGLRFNARSEARRKVVVREWIARLEEAGAQQ